MLQNETTTQDLTQVESPVTTVDTSNPENVEAFVNFMQSTFGSLTPKVGKMHRVPIAILQQVAKTTGIANGIKLKTDIINTMHRYATNYSQRNTQ